MTNSLRNPFPGLRPFDTEEDYLFFGREEQTNDLLQLLRSSRFVAVVGTSGSGKSSLVRAGLIPDLVKGSLGTKGGSWNVAVARPAGDPLRRLAVALRDAELYDRDEVESVPRIVATLRRSTQGLIEAFRQSMPGENSRLLLVVDQFEELFRYHDDEVEARDQRRAFVNLLLEATAQDELPIYVVVTMRSDYLGDCARVPGLAEAINVGEYLVPRLGREQIRRAIEGPARVGGGGVTRRFVQQLFADLGDDADQLPVLQHALMRAWDARGDATELDLEHYASIGGLSEALSRHADEVFDGLSDNRLRATAERVFKTLTETERGDRGVRRPTRVTRLEAVCRDERANVEAVIDAFRASDVSFLMPGPTTSLDGDPVVDISHESLMRVWTRLRTWVAEEAQSASTYRRLAESAALWREERAGLFRHPDLDVAQSWREKAQPNPSWASLYAPGYEHAIAFLDASQLAADDEEREREVARARELEQARELAATKTREAEAIARTARNFRRFAIGLSCLVVVVLALAVQALRLWHSAEESRESALRSEAVARHEQGIAWLERAQSLRDQQRHAAAQLLAARTIGFEGVQLPQEDSREPDARRLDRPLLDPASEEAKTARELLASSVVDVLAYQSPLTSFHGARRAAWTPDGLRVVIGDTDGRVSIYDVATGQLENQFPAHGMGISFVGMTADGRAAVTTSDRSETIYCHDLTTGENRWEAQGAGRSLHATLSSDRTLLAVAGTQKVSVIDATDGNVLTAISPGANGVAMARDGSKLAVLHADGWLRVWTTNGELVGAVIHGVSASQGVAFTEDGRRIVAGPLRTSNGDTPAKVWEVGDDGSLTLAAAWEIPVLAERSDSWFGLSRVQIVSEAAGRDEEIVVLGGSDGRVYLRRLRDGSDAGVLDAHGKTILGLAVDPSGRRLMTVASDEPPRLWDLGTLRELSTLGDVELARSLDHSVDGRFVVTAQANGEIRVLDGRTGQLAAKQQVDISFNRIRFAPDGTRLAAGGRHAIRVFDVTGSVLSRDDFSSSSDGTIADAGFRELDRMDGPRFGWSPDSQTLAYQSTDFGVFLWSAASRSSRGIYDSGTRAYVRLAFTPDGNHLAVTSLTKTELLDMSGTIVGEWPQLGSSAGLVFQPGGGHIVSVGRDFVNLWTRDAPPVNVGRLEHPELGYDTRLEFSGDGGFLAASGGDEVVRVYDMRRRTLVAQLEGAARSVVDVSFAPDGRTLAVASLDNSVRYWRLERHVNRDSLVVDGLRHRKVRFLDDDHVVVYGGERKVAIVDRHQGAIVRLLDGAPNQAGTECQIGMSNEFGGPYIALSDRGHTAVWDTSTGELIVRLANPTSVNSRAAFDPEGRWVAVSRGTRLHVFEFSTRTLRDVPIAEPIRDLSVSGAGTLVLLEDDGELRLVDAASGADQGVIGQVDTTLKYDITMADDGDTFVISEKDRFVSIWSISERAQRSRFEIPTQESLVFEIALSPDGRNLAVATGETIQLWSTAGEPLLEYARPGFDPNFSPTGVDFSPDGRSIAGGSSSSTIALWELRPRAWEAGHLSSLLDIFRLDGRQVVSKRPETVFRATPARRVAGGESEPLEELAQVLGARNVPAAVAAVAALPEDLRLRGTSRALSTLSREVDTLSRRGWTRVALRLAEAAQELARSGGSSDLLLQQRRAEALLRAGRRDESIALFEKTVEQALSSDSHATARGIARARVTAHLELGDSDGAREAFSRLWSLPGLESSAGRSRLHGEIRRYVRRAGWYMAEESVGKTSRDDRLLACVFIELLLDAIEGSPRLSGIPALDALVEQASQGKTELELVPLRQTWSIPPVGVALNPDGLSDAFDASAWPTATGPVHFSTTSGRPELRSSGIVLMARTRFRLPDEGLPPGYGLVIQSRSRPSARVFINGIEVVRHGLPEGALETSTSALPYSRASNLEDWTEASLAEPLRAGENSVAVELRRSERGFATLNLQIVARVTPSAYLAAIDPDRALRAAALLLPPRLLEELTPRWRFSFATDTGSSPASTARTSDDWMVRARIQRALGRPTLAAEAYEKGAEAAAAAGDGVAESSARAALQELRARRR